GRRGRDAGAENSVISNSEATTADRRVADPDRRLARPSIPKAAWAKGRAGGSRSPARRPGRVREGPGQNPRGVSERDRSDRPPDPREFPAHAATGELRRVASDRRATTPILRDQPRPLRQDHRPDKSHRPAGRSERVHGGTTESHTEAARDPDRVGDRQD